MAKGKIRLMQINIWVFRNQILGADILFLGTTYLTCHILFQTNRTCPICRGDAANYFSAMSE